MTRGEYDVIETGGVPIKAWIRGVPIEDAARRQLENVARLPFIHRLHSCRCLMSADETTTLFRPVGPQELTLIRESGFRRFPPRLPAQPTFYPVLTEAYAVKIARDWNARDSGAGYVTRFAVRRAFLACYRVQEAGGAAHREYWIPAEDLAAFNENIVGPIEIVGEFHAGERR